VAKLIDSIIIEPSNSSGATECFLISQPLIGGTLGQLLPSQSLSMTSRLLLLEHMLDGLAFLHSEGCMHRDIKPDNILASLSPVRAVIIDFGCATWETSSKDHMKGTIRYLAPEIISLKENTAPQNATYNMSADIWSMGLTAYELLRGSRARFQRISWRFYDEELLATINIASALGSNEVRWAFDLIKEMLRWDPKSRIKSEHARLKCPTSEPERQPRQLQPGKREHESGP
jgi:serine/threonine protein kinase